MADLEHLKILKEGVEVWNKWREKDAPINPDLSEADLCLLDLSRANLRRTAMTGSLLIKTNLSEANLHQAGLIGAHLREPKTCNN